MSDDLELKWIQCTPQRTVTNGTWDKGIIDCNFTVGGNLAWIPSKSYFRIGMKITGVGGTAQPTVGEQVAFADSVCGNLFNNIYYRAGGQDVSSIINYAPQASAIRNRLGKTGAWLDTVGKVSYGLDPEFSSRVSAVATGKSDDDTNTTRLSPLCAEANFETATVAITGATGAVVGVGTTLNVGLPVGSQILDTTTGVIYTVAVVSADATGTNMIVSPAPLANIAATAKRFFKITQTKSSGSRNEVYYMYQPPVGIFDEDTPQGSGDYRISMNPSSTYKTAAIETSRTGTVAGTTYNFEITDFSLYVATVRMAVPQTGVETIHLMENLIQSKPLVAGEQVYDFTVPPSTTAISVFMQAGSAGSDARIPPSIFKNATEDDLTLQSLQLVYANQVKPTTRWSSDFTSTKNQLTQRYVDSQTNSGMIYSPGGCESYDDWLKRGPIYHFSFERDSNDRSTQLQLHVNYTSMSGTSNNIFVCSHYRRTVSIETSNGFVQSVNSLST